MHSTFSGLHIWYRGFIQGKTRVTLAWLFSGLLIFSAREYPNLPGIIVCFLGATIRFWASGFLCKDSKVSVGGPYALTRNPLYLGTYLMAVGTALAIANWWLFGTVSILFATVYHYIILDEENKLIKAFGKPYSMYCLTTPRFLPRIIPVSRKKLLEINPDENQLRFSMSLAMKNRAYEAYAAFVGLIGAMYLIAYMWKNFLA